MNWDSVSLVVLGLTAFFSAFIIALWISLVIWTFRDMRSRTRDAFAQLLASLMVLILGPFGVILYLILRPRETLAEKYERSLEEEALLQDIEERHICPGCKQPIEPDFMICPVCHTRLRQPCIHCERLIHPRWNVCPYCGESQRPVPGVETAGRVTLADLEVESETSLQLESLPQEETDAVEALEEEAMRNLDRVEYAKPLVPEWEPEEEGGDSEQADSEEVESRSPAVEGASDDLIGGTSGPRRSGAGTAQGNEEEPRRTLSLFRRS